MLLGVNEPDGTIGGGSKPTTPEEYAKLWPTIVDTARGKGYTDFAGPQLASSDPNNLGVGLDWQVRFMTALDQELVGKEKSSYLTYVSGWGERELPFSDPPNRAFTRTPVYPWLSTSKGCGCLG